MTPRAALLEAHRGSARRPYVVIAMIRITAMLSKITKVAHGFAEQLSKNAYVYIEEGILKITDQIMLAVDEGDDPDNVGSEEVMAGIPVSFAKQERAAREAEG